LRQSDAVDQRPRGATRLTWSDLDSTEQTNVQLNWVTVHFNDRVRPLSGRCAVHEPDIQSQSNSRHAAAPTSRWSHSAAGDRLLPCEQWCRYGGDAESGFCLPGCGDAPLMAHGTGRAEDLARDRLALRDAVHRIGEERVVAVAEGERSRPNRCPRDRSRIEGHRREGGAGRAV